MTTGPNHRCFLIIDFPLYPLKAEYPMLQSSLRTDDIAVPVNVPNVVDIIRKHLPAIRETARVSGSRNMRKMIRDFEAIVQAADVPGMQLSSGDTSNVIQQLVH